MKLFLYLLPVMLWLGGCASSETPSYILTDSKLHQYQGGDSLTYSVLSIGNTSDATGLLVHRYENVDFLDPNLETRKTLIQQTETQGNIQLSFATPIFTQTETGSLMLDGYSDSSVPYWITESESSGIGEIFYPSPVSDLTNTNISRTLLVCDNRVCVNGGNTNLQLVLSGTEEIKTEYANFVAYKINMSWDVTIQSNQTADNTLKTYRISGTQWFYPPLGTVRFEYSLETDIGDNITMIGVLTSTNINIPSENKSQ